VPTAVSPTAMDEVNIVELSDSENNVHRLIGYRNELFVPFETAGNNEFCAFFAMQPAISDEKRVSISNMSTPPSNNDIARIRAYCRDALESRCFREGKVAVAVDPLEGYLHELLASCKAQRVKFPYGIPRGKRAIVETYINATVNVDFPRDTFFISALARYSGLNLRIFVVPEAPQKPYVVEDLWDAQKRTCNVLLYRSHFRTCFSLTPEDTVTLRNCYPQIDAPSTAVFRAEARDANSQKQPSSADAHRVDCRSRPSHQGRQRCFRTSSHREWW